MASSKDRLTPSAKVKNGLLPTPAHGEGIAQGALDR